MSAVTLANYCSAETSTLSEGWNFIVMRSYPGVYDFYWSTDGISFTTGTSLVKTSLTNDYSYPGNFITIGSYENAATGYAYYAPTAYMHSLWIWPDLDLDQYDFNNTILAALI